MRVAVDIGGTFTDVTAFDEASGRIALGKVLSTPANLVDGIAAAMARTGVSAAEAELIIHGSTIVINAILERKGAKAALITTQGFGDVYEIGRINRPESFNLFFRKHRPLIPRDLIFEVPERILADGSEETPLDEEAARAVVQRVRALGVEAVAIVFLHSYRSPEHEIRMRDIVREAAPEIFVTASHELSREYREYERTSTVAANAYVGPIVSRYLGDLEERLAADGFGGGLMIMQSSGGLTDVETARRQCVQMLESGPAGGVVGSIALCEALDITNAICFDMGGTTAKACVVRRGQPDVSPDYFVGGYNEGLAIRIPVLDIKEVGTGGGSIAWIDEGGALHVGPESAGAEPGPVCYGRGGTEPTVTDADVVLGRISAEQFLGGEMRLDAEAARRAIRADRGAARRHSRTRGSRDCGDSRLVDGERYSRRDDRARAGSARLLPYCVWRRWASARRRCGPGVGDRQHRRPTVAGPLLGVRYADGRRAAGLRADALRTAGERRDG